MTQCKQQDGKFKLCTLLRSSTPLKVVRSQGGEEVMVYDARSLLSDKIEQYLYFAASVFWRAAAHQWKMGSEQVGRISMGIDYVEQFRKYLLGEDPFPSNARLFVHVSNEEQLYPIIIYPSTVRIDRVRRHKFYVPGILFILFLGGGIKQHDGLALNGSNHQVVWLCPLKEDSIFSGMLKRIGAATPRGKLRR